MGDITVYADVSCPFAYVGLSRIQQVLAELGDAAPALSVRSWPLELVNGAPLTGPGLGPKVEALRRDVAPDLFAGFDPGTFPTTTLPALAAEHAAHRVSPTIGLTCSLALRRALFEDGADIGDPAIVAEVLATLDAPMPTDVDEVGVDTDHTDGIIRGVQGSPHFFTNNGDFFCPTLDISHDEDGYAIEFDPDGFDRFLKAALG